MEEADRKKCPPTGEEGLDTHTHTSRYSPVTHKDHEKHVEPTLESAPKEGETHTHRYVPVTRKDHEKHIEDKIPKVAPETGYDRRYHPGGRH